MLVILCVIAMIVITELCPDLAPKEATMTEEEKDQVIHAKERHLTQPVSHNIPEIQEDTDLQNGPRSYDDCVINKGPAIHEGSIIDKGQTLNNIPAFKKGHAIHNAPLIVESTGITFDGPTVDDPPNNEDLATGTNSSFDMTRIKTQPDYVCNRVEMDNNATSVHSHGE